MLIRSFVLSVVLGIALAASAVAQSFEDSVVRQLQQLGYSNITISRTLLGRSRIKARNEEGRREIVIDPRTGVILRDYFYLRRSDDTDVPRILGSGNGGSGGQDDDDDDEDEYDNSGKGSFSSGSGKYGDGDDDRSDNSGSGGGGGSSGSGGGDDDDDD